MTLFMLLLFCVMVSIFCTQVAAENEVVILFPEGTLEDPCVTLELANFQQSSIDAQLRVEPVCRMKEYPITQQQHLYPCGAIQRVLERCTFSTDSPTLSVIQAALWGLYEVATESSVMLDSNSESIAGSEPDKASEFTHIVVVVPKLHGIQRGPRVLAAALDVVHDALVNASQAVISRRRTSVSISLPAVDDIEDVPLFSADELLLSVFGDHELEWRYDNGGWFMVTRTQLRVQRAKRKDSQIRDTLQSLLLAHSVYVQLLPRSFESKTSASPDLQFLFKIPSLRTGLTTEDVSRSDNSSMLGGLLHVGNDEIGRNVTYDDILTSRDIPVLEWDSAVEGPFTQYVMDTYTEPVVIKDKQMQTWPCFSKWKDSEYLSSKIGDMHMPKLKQSIKHADDKFPMLFLDLDTRAKMCDVPDFAKRYCLPDKLRALRRYEVLHNLTVDDFLRVTDGDADDSEALASEEKPLLYWFQRVPEVLQEDLTDTQDLFYSDHDRRSYKQYIWASSGGVKMHTHFDQDHNLFVQIVGTKKFTLFSGTYQHFMFPYSRLHPMWHKSQVHLDMPDLQRFPEYANVHARQVILGPGDVLYVPPYTWHHVESLTYSLSLSSWSHDDVVYNAMNEVYKHDYFFDTLSNPEAKVYALKLYFDFMLDNLYGEAQGHVILQTLVKERLEPLREYLDKSDIEICSMDDIPLSRNLVGSVQFDATIQAPLFLQFAPHKMDFLFADYLEEITVNVIGIDSVYGFLTQCFRKQGYRFTNPDSEEHHRLWTIADSEEDEEE